MGGCRGSELLPNDALQSVDADSSLAVTQFGERRGCERNLGKRWQPLVDEPLEPAQRRTLVAFRISGGEELA